MENISNSSLESQTNNISNESLWNLAKNSIIVIVVIIVILLLIYGFTKKSNNNLEFANNLTNSQQITYPSKNLAQTKQTYKQFDEITLPSSIDGKMGYVGRDFICFRDKISDQQFVSKRNGCMACQVDNNKVNPITGTNVVSTCVYGDNINDPSVWSHAMCESKCSQLTKSP